jgi:hypothetical protein
LLDRVVLIGASATHGFNVTIDVEVDAEVAPHGEQAPAAGSPARRVRVRKPVGFADVFDVMIRNEHRPVIAHSNLFFFARPIHTGPQLMKRALQSKPTLIVGVDYLFWYGYGSANRDGAPIASEEERLQLLEEGLKLVEELPCLIVLGDFGDMSGAVGGMLAAEQMPKAETLVKLNARLREWASRHPNVILLPLADLVRKMQEDKGFTIAGHEYAAGTARSGLIQSDDLHPTALGLVALGQLVAEHLMKHDSSLTPDRFNLDPEAVIDELRRRASEKARTGK